MYIYQLVEEYKKIGLNQEISDLQAERLDRILEIAESNTLLSDLICQTDLEIAEELNLLNQEMLNHYKDQEGKLREKIRSELSNSVNQNIPTLENQIFLALGI